MSSQSEQMTLSLECSKLAFFQISRAHVLLCINPSIGQFLITCENWIGSEVYAMKIKNVSLSQCSKEKSVRCDWAYQNMASKYYETDEPYYSFYDLFEVLEEKINSDDLVGNFQYCQIGDVGKDGTPSPVILDFNDRNLLDESYYSKIEKGDIMRVEKDDILMSFLLPQDPQIKGKFTYIDSSSENILFSTAFLRIKGKTNSKILFYALRSIFYPDVVATARIRKGYTGYATLSKDDLEDLKFSKNTIDLLFNNSSFLEKAINDLESRISLLKSTTRTSSEIIDEVFEKEFSFDYKKFEELKKNKIYFSQESTFSNNPDLRFSAKFHRPAGEFVMSELQRITDRKIKHYISEPIMLGASISPKDFDENGTAYYISMATIKTLNVELDNTQLISDSYFDAKSNKSVMPNDIILARSGVAIGKSAIVEESFDGVFADFTMRLRFDEARCDPHFAYYYIRSKYFQYLIEIYKKGLQNQNIFPIIIQEFPFPNISLAEQNKIVDMIQIEMRKQSDTKQKIAELRNNIDLIIESAITA